MEEKKYRIVNNFTDAYTGERYTRNHKPIPFSDERVDEIRKVEKIQGYPLIEEVVGEPNEVDTTNVTEEIDTTVEDENNKKSNKKNKRN